MKKVLAALFMLGMCVGDVGAYDSRVVNWEEIPVPQKWRTAEGEIWASAANWSEHEWRVSMKDSIPIAELLPRRRERKEFRPEAGQFGDEVVRKVTDGWLVGINRGEWGGELCWYTNDGKTKSKISDDQVVAFLDTPDGILAIEGCAHMMATDGSIIRIWRAGSEWKSVRVVTLPQTPMTAAVMRNGDLLLVLWGSLVRYSKKAGMQTLINDAPWGWGGLYPNSIILSEDEGRAYIGMRQYVAEYDLAKGSLRFLIPDKSFLNRPGPETEASIRERYEHYKHCESCGKGYSEGE